jgi:hypothetical protein
MNPKLPALNTESVGTHHREILIQKEFHGIYGGEDTHQGHDPECNDQDGQNGPQKMKPDGSQRDPDILI